MGFIRHHAIIVTSWSMEALDAARTQAVKLRLDCSDIAHSPVNGYETFLAGPDGSKEGWADSDRGDKRRSQFIEWLEQQVHGDGSGPFEWVEVSYGSDDGRARVLRHAWKEEAEQP